MIQNAKMQKTVNEGFLQNCKKTKMETFAFFVITFEPIKIKTCSAPQNDRHNLSFVKDANMVGQKMAGNGRKMAIYQSVLNRNSLYVYC